MPKNQFKVYIETSVWGSLEDRDNSPWRRSARRLVDVLRKHVILVSDVVLEELNRNPDTEERHRIRKKLRDARPMVLAPHFGLVTMARELQALGLLSEAHIADLLHLGYAIHWNADALVTWNLADLAREHARRVVRAYCRERGMRVPLIGTPKEVAQWLGIALR